MGNKKKNEQLGMAYGTAANRLRKSILFKLIVAGGYDTCHRCGEKIETERELSIEHKVPWLDSEDPKGLFFDLNNIAFSHLSCNCRASTGGTPKGCQSEHGSLARYDRWGCRCDKCKAIKRERQLESRIRTGRKKS
jgi:hypothetical protein